MLNITRFGWYYDYDEIYNDIDCGMVVLYYLIVMTCTDDYMYTDHITFFFFFDDHKITIIQ